MTARDERLNRLTRLSDRLFGEASETDLAEAEELLRAAGVDAAKLKTAMYRRMQKKAQEYSSAKKVVPALVERALEDLDRVQNEAKSTIRRLLEQIRNLPALLARRPALVFTAAYRTQKELSEGDKKLLDEITDELRGRVADGKSKK